MVENSHQQRLLQTKRLRSQTVKVWFATFLFSYVETLLLDAEIALEVTLFQTLLNLC